MLTQERAVELFSYNCQGYLVRRIDHAMTKKGQIAGCLSGDSGYRVVKVDGALYREHRLIWLYHYGVFPEFQIDHINGVRHDNRIENLRDVTNLENHRNIKKRCDNTSGVTGVYYRPETKGWRAIIYVNGKAVGLGHYKEKVEAIDARAKAEIKYGFHKNHGRD